MSAHEQFDNQIAEKMVGGLPINNQDIIQSLDLEFPGGQHLEGEAGREAIDYVRGLRRYLEGLDQASCFAEPGYYSALCPIFDALVGGNIRIEQGLRPIMTGSFNGVEYANPEAYFEMAHQFMRNRIFAEAQAKFTGLNLSSVAPETHEMLQIELEIAGITGIEADQNHSDVFTGKIGSYAFEFQRKSNYWILSGALPVSVAQSMRKNPVGRRDIRGSMAHEEAPFFEQFSIIDTKGNSIGLDPTGKWSVRYDQALSKGSTIFPNNLKFVQTFDSIPDDELFVSSFHIDTQMGLSFFTSSITGEIQERERSRAFSFEKFLGSMRALVSRLFPSFQ